MPTVTLFEAAADGMLTCGQQDDMDTNICTAESRRGAYSANNMQICGHETMMKLKIYTHSQVKIAVPLF